MACVCVDVCEGGEGDRWRRNAEGKNAGRRQRVKRESCFGPNQTEKGETEDRNRGKTRGDRRETREERDENREISQEFPTGWA